MGKRIFTCFRILGLLFLYIVSPVTAISGSITGTVTDRSTGERLAGAQLLIQGTLTGTLTDFDGYFCFADLKAGTYPIMVRFISYESQLLTVVVGSEQEIALNIAMVPAMLDLGEVEVVAKKRTDTEMALITSLKSQDLIMNGISSQQIAKSQDRDAAEVLRRVPGITITDGRFVIVRGLTERYNSVMLNNATAPSFEPDKRAFSFDAIPSGLIDNMLIYKSPSPELPADFAGAVIDVQTRSAADENSLIISYGTKYVEHTSLNPRFQTYKGSKSDWLGFDNGTRGIPKGVPPTETFTSLYSWDNIQDYLTKTQEISRISGHFANNWMVGSRKPFLDQNFSVTLQKRFVLRKISIGNITALNYQHLNDLIRNKRAEYENYDETTGLVYRAFDFDDVKSSQSARLGVIFNWSLFYGNNQKLEIRNFLNNMGTVSANVRNGINYYNVETLRLFDLKFIDRLVYSGQVAGEQHFFNKRTRIGWMVGFGLTINDQPDNRRLTFVLDENETSLQKGNYYLRIQNQPNAYLGGRLWLRMDERTNNVKLDIDHSFKLSGLAGDLKIKAGILYNTKWRDFSSRMIGLIALKNPPVDFYQPVQDILKPGNFFFDETPPYSQHGLSYDDNTRAKDSYRAHDEMKSGYVNLTIPLLSDLTINAGVRTEKFFRKIYDFYEPAITPGIYDIVRDTVNFFPSVNISCHFSENRLLRVSYGKTVNRPEFREMSNFDYQDFDLFVLQHGNDQLQNAYIGNYDIRYEWYPRIGEIISFSGFYKYFRHPVEIFLIPAGTGYDYKPFNTEKGYSAGLELDIRKSLDGLGSQKGILQYLKGLAVVFNASLIKSEIITRQQAFARDSKRIMQGQSPYIVNLGLNYSGENSGFVVYLNYNLVGKRIAYVGTPTNPHTWELPRNSLDLTFQKGLSERLSIKAGIKDIINDPVRFMQRFGANEQMKLYTVRYNPNRSFSLTLTYKL